VAQGGVAEPQKRAKTALRELYDRELPPQFLW